jgi:hypothetical protein
MILRLPIKRRRLLRAAAILFVVVITLVTAGAIYVTRTNDSDAIATASAWARIAPLPSSAHDRQIEVKGSMFTREFVITFVDSPGAVQHWIADSPGPASARQIVNGSITIYNIAPGGGAEFAEVRVDSNTGKVVIRTYWS